MKMESRLSEKTPGETEVAMASDVNVTGIMAQFGRGLVQDVSNQMFQKFTEAVRAELERPDEAPPAETPPVSAPAEPSAVSGTTTAAPAPLPSPPSPSASISPASAPASAPPIEVFSFGGKILARATGRMMRRPLFWVVVAAAAVLIYRLSH